MAMEGLWKGLFDWSMRYQDGTTPSDGPKPMTNDDRKWLEEAFKAQTIDLSERMRDIKGKLEGPGGESGLEVQDKEHLLDELMDIVDFIDLARDLHTIGGLPVLLSLLQDPAPKLRAKAAEVVATCAQNNEPVQDWMVAGGTFPPLLTLLEQQDVPCRVKALLALSCLVRENGGALDRLRALGGLRHVTAAVGGGQAVDLRLQRKALQLLKYWLRERPADAPCAVQQGLIAGLANAVSSQDGDVCQAALALAAALVRIKETRGATETDAQLQQALEGVQQRLDSLSGEDAEAALDQAAQLTALRSALAAPPTVSAAGADPGGKEMVMVMKKP